MLQWQRGDDKVSQAWDVSGGAGEKWEQELRGRGAWGYHLSKVGNRPADLGSSHAATCGQVEAGVCWRNKGGGRNEARAKSQAVEAVTHFSKEQSSTEE